MCVWFTHAYLCCHPEIITDKYCTTKVRPQNNDFHFSNTPKSSLTYSSRKINTSRDFNAKINTILIPNIQTHGLFKVLMCKNSSEYCRNAALLARLENISVSNSLQLLHVM